MYSDVHCKGHRVINVGEGYPVSLSYDRSFAMTRLQTAVLAVIPLPDTPSNEEISVESKRVVTAWLELHIEAVNSGGTNFYDFKLGPNIARTSV
jgi:hypothetical protein